MSSEVQVDLEQALLVEYGSGIETKMPRRHSMDKTSPD
jgi:hypothetical protein